MLTLPLFKRAEIGLLLKHGGGYDASETVPATQSTVSFAQSGMTLIADIDATISKLDLDKSIITEYSLAAKNGKTLTISSFPNSGVKEDTTLNIGSTTDDTLGGTIKISGAWKNTVFNVNSGNLIGTPTTDATGHYNSTFNIAKDSSVTLGKGLNGDNTKFNVYGTLTSSDATLTVYNSGCYFNLYEGATFNAHNVKFAQGATANSDGSYNKRIFIDGTINVSNGETSRNTRYYAIRFGDCSNSTSNSVNALKGQKGIYDIGEHAVIRQTSSDSKKYLVETTSILNIANGAKMYLQNGFGLIGYATVNINAQNVFFTEDLNDKDQRNSKFVVTDKSGSMLDVSPTLNVNMDNNFGNVEFDITNSSNKQNARLIINLAEGVEVSFKSLFSNYATYEEMYNNLEEICITFEINGLSDKQNFKVTDMDDILEKYNNSESFLKFVDKNKNTLYVTELGGDYFISADMLAIPEPAEWAMILGFATMLFAMYRRRK